MSENKDEKKNNRMPILSRARPSKSVVPSQRFRWILEGPSPTRA